MPDVDVVPEVLCVVIQETAAARILDDKTLEVEPVTLPLGLTLLTVGTLTFADGGRAFLFEVKEGDRFFVDPDAVRTIDVGIEIVDGELEMMGG